MNGDSDPAKEIAALKSALERARSATSQAESLLEGKSAELYKTNQILLKHKEELEAKVAERTRDLNEKVAQLEVIQNDLRRERDRAREESAGKTTAFAKLSHEIRTPLNGILGTLNLLSDSDLNDEQLEILSLTLSSSEILRFVLNDAIDLARLEQGAIELEATPFKLAPWLDDIADFWSGAALLNGQTIRVANTINGQSMVTADAGRLRQIVNNLVSNAIKYAGPGEITIAAEEELEQKNRSNLILSVIDEGTPLPASERELLFNIYRRSNSREGRKVGKGAGLGLTISRELAQLMNGDVKCLPVEGKAGNMFTVKIPAEIKETATIQSSHPDTDRANIPMILPKPGERSLRALVVDDVPTNQLILERYMKALGFRIDLANNGLEALDAAKNHDYDVILMDIAMPLMDGYEATKQIKAIDEKRAKIPIIAVSAHIAKNEADKVRSYGIFEYLEKPIDRGRLEFILASLFHSKANEEYGTAISVDEDPIIAQFQKDFRTCVLAVQGALDHGERAGLMAAMHKLSGLASTFDHPRAEEIREIYVALQTSEENERAIRLTKDLIRDFK